MITIKNRKLIIPKEDRVIGTVSDNNSETRIFVIDRYLANGIDLAALTFGMDMEYEDGTTRNATYITKEVTDEVINLTWGIVEGDVQKAGTMFVQITAFDYDGTVKWATIRDAFYVEPVIGTAEEYTGDLSAFQRMEAVLDEKLAELSDYEEDLSDIEEAEAGRVEAENGRVSAEGDRVLAEEGRVEAESQREATFSTLAKESEAWAVGTKDGSPVPNTDPQYHNYSKYYAEAAGASAQSASDDATLALGYKEDAASSASNASTSETNAGNSETAAAGSATSAASKATLAESYAKGGTGTRTGENTDNAKYYAEQAAASAQSAADSAEQAAAIVGGHYVSYDAQTLAPADQKQVRSNIAAIGYAGFTSIMNTIWPTDDSRDEVFTTEAEHYYAAHAHTEGSLFWITIDEEVYLVVADQAIAIGDEIAASEVNIIYAIEDIYDQLANIYTKTDVDTLLNAKGDNLKLVGNKLSLEHGNTELSAVYINEGGSTIVQPPVPKVKTYTYDGTEQTFEWDSIDTNHIIVTNNKKTAAGTYTVTASLKGLNDYWYDAGGTVSRADKTFTWTIDQQQVAVPVAASQSYTYDGTQQTFAFSTLDSAHTVVTGNKQTNAGSYTVTAALLDANFVWADTTTADKTYSWTIGKAAGDFTLSANTASVTRATPTATVNVTGITGDGIVSVASSDSTVATASYSNGVVTITGLDNGTATITVSLAEGTNYLATSKNIAVTSEMYKILTVKIDLTDSNPATCCSYADNAIGMTQAQIQDFLGYKPCLFVNGAVDGYLNPDNYAQYEDGTSADITTLGNDVMVEFPKRGYKISTSNNVVSISITDNPNATGFCYKPFSRAAEGDRSAFYYGAYKGYCTNSMMYSTSGKQPTSNQTRATFRSWASARGTGYAQNGFYQLTYLQCCYVMQFANLNSQEAVGYGYVNSNHGDTTVNRSVNTGGTNAYGMNCEVIKVTNPTYMTDQDHQVKCLGIEDFWGNLWQWVDGATTDSSTNIFTCFIPSKFSDSTDADGQVNQGQGATADIGDYMTKPQGGTDTGFIPKECNGSSSTYFCDIARLAVAGSYVIIHGGSWANALMNGVFRTVVNNVKEVQNFTIASRLMYV